MTSDESEYLDENGGVPAIEISLDPVTEIPLEDLVLIGEMMAWTAYIEVDLFMLFLLANPGDEIRRRKQFYRETIGLNARIRLIRRSYEGRLTGQLAQALEALLAEAEVLAQIRNEWAHNPIIRFGPKRKLLRWIVGSGEYAGKLEKVEASQLRPHMPSLQRLHQNFTNLGALINSPSGTSYAFAFGERTEEVEARIARYLDADVTSGA